MDNLPSMEWTCYPNSVNTTKYRSQIRTYPVPSQIRKVFYSSIETLRAFKRLVCSDPDILVCELLTCLLEIIITKIPQNIVTTISAKPMKMVHGKEKGQMLSSFSCKRKKQTIYYVFDTLVTNYLNI